MAVLEDMAGLIIAGGQASVMGTDIYGGFTPTTPDNIVVLMESSGFDPTRTMSGIAFDELNLQTLIRNVKSVDAETKAFAIRVILDGYKGTIGANVYKSILARQKPFQLGQDENKRYRYSCNFLVRVKIG